jgi:hypothetical protein
MATDLMKSHLGNADLILTQCGELRPINPTFVTSGDDHLVTAAHRVKADVSRPLSNFLTSTAPSSKSSSKRALTPILPKSSRPRALPLADARSVDQDFLEFAYRAPRGALCLLTALARHNLTDAIPDRIDVAIPRGARIPALRPIINVHASPRRPSVPAAKRSISVTASKWGRIRLNARWSMSFVSGIERAPTLLRRRFVGGFVASGHPSR